jgi:mannose-1-phosphate guanylyltransferase
MNYGVILAGGKGERFWPLSTRERPKQLLKLASGKTMLEDTLERLEGFIPLERTLLVTGANLEKSILSTVKELTRTNLLLEPQGKNTCLALALAAVHINQLDPNGVMIVLSSDHMIQPKEQLVKILGVASELAAREDKLITIGIIPNRAETGYGYIQVGPQASEIGGIKFHDVVGFKEKPERTKAQEYYLDRKHLWNSGMFVWSVKSFLKALDRFMPEMSACLKKYGSAAGNKQDTEAIKCLYNDCESISVDFAILEKADNVLCVKGDIRWDDLGSWLALQRIHPPDRENNIIIGEVVSQDSYETTIVNASADGLVVGFGVSDLIIVKTDRIVMVAHKTRAAELKELLSKLDKDEKNQQYL